VRSGVLPRVGANAEDIKWLPYKVRRTRSDAPFVEDTDPCVSPLSQNSFPGHVSNAFENEDGEICIDSGLSSGEQPSE
jgi:hypothetical protein